MLQPIEVAVPTLSSFSRGRFGLLALVPLLGGTLIAATGAAPAPVEAPSGTRVRTGYAWSPAQVRELIGAIRQARRAGLDPDAYGLAALRAELDLCEQLWNTAGSRQLDTLARVSALALANDYRHRAAAAPVRPAELDAALGAKRVGLWLASQASRQPGRVS